MNTAALEVILQGIKPVLDEQGMKRQEGDEEIFLGDKYAVKVWYDEKPMMFKLDVATLEEGQPVDFNTVSSWLFDDAHNERDAAAIAADFADSLSIAFGVKKAVVRQREISLPSKAAPGSTPGVEAFAQRFLTLFPQFKDTYKEDFAQYGEFLYENFFSKTAAVHLKALVAEKNKKQLVKFFNMLDEFYVEGDYNVQSVITYTIIGGAFGDDLALFEEMQPYLTDAQHLVVPCRTMIGQVISKEKRGSGSAK